jgi:tetratricopeptide (TPR) repeat protein
MVVRAKIEREVQKHIIKKEWGKAISLYEDLIDKGGESGDVYNRLGDMYMKKRDRAAAIEKYLKAIDLYIKDELYENGTAVCSKMLRYGIERPDLYFRMAQLNTKLNLGFEAIRWFNMYLKNDSALECLEKFMNEYQEMLMLLANHELLYEQVKNVYIKVGIELEAMDDLFGMKKEGVTEEEEGVLLSTITSIKEYIEKGYKRDKKGEIEIYKSLKLHKQAIGILQQQLKEAPDDIEAMKLLGLCFLENHKPRLASRIFKYIIQNWRLSRETIDEIRTYLDTAREKMRYVTT